MARSETGCSALSDRVLIRADRSVPFKTIRSALHGARLAGVHSAFLVTFEGSAISLIFNGAT